MRLVLAAAFAAAAAGVPSPPVIHEPFTPLPCPAHPSTTLALEGCAERDLLRLDRAIDVRVARIYGLLARSRRAGFVRGETAWLGYRRASCSAEASKYAGGTLEPVQLLWCEQFRDKTHLEDLAELEGVLRQH